MMGEESSRNCPLDKLLEAVWDLFVLIVVVGAFVILMLLFAK